MRSARTLQTVPHLHSNLDGLPDLGDVSLNRQEGKERCFAWAATRRGIIGDYIPFARSPNFVGTKQKRPYILTGDVLQFSGGDASQGSLVGPSHGAKLPPRTLRNPSHSAGLVHAGTWQNYFRFVKAV
jgi:hypothetical protein